MTGATGAQGTPGVGGTVAAWGSFWDTTNQTTTANTPTAITFNSYDANSRDVSIGSPTSRIVFADTGTYSLTFSIQFTNHSTALGTAQVWLKKNGTNVPDTNSHYDVPDKQGSAFTSNILTVNFVLDLVANDYVELYWDTTNANVYLETLAGNATYPQTPSIIFTATQVTYTQAGPTGATGTTGLTGATGTQGASGISGATGINGASGIQGATGVQGASGSIGLTGSTGPSAVLGSLNYATTLGASGFSSATGATGIVFSAAPFTGNGGPIEVTVYGDANPLVGGSWNRLQLYRDSTAIGTPVQAESSAANENVPYSLHVIDNPGAGTFTYSLRSTVSAGGGWQFGEAGTGTFTVKELNNVRGATGAAGATGTAGINGATGAGVPYTSALVNAGSFVTLDNLKATVTTSGSRGLSLATVSGSISGYVGAQWSLTSGSNGGSAYSISLTTTASSSVLGYGFPGEGDTSWYILRDNTNTRVYRIVLVIGGSYINNFISIERLL